MGELCAHFDKNIFILIKIGGKIRFFLMIFDNACIDAGINDLVSKYVKRATFMQIRVCMLWETIWRMSQNPKKNA